MMAIVGNRTLTDDALSTTMCLVEQILNSRPLTSVSDDLELQDGLSVRSLSWKRWASEISQ